MGFHFAQTLFYCAEGQRSRVVQRVVRDCYGHGLLSRHVPCIYRGVGVASTWLRAANVPLSLLALHNCVRYVSGLRVQTPEYPVLAGREWFVHSKRVFGHCCSVEFANLECPFSGDHSGASGERVRSSGEDRVYRVYRVNVACVLGGREMVVGQVYEWVGSGRVTFFVRSLWDAPPFNL